jgi:hypothetical protein
VLQCTLSSWTLNWTGNCYLEIAIKSVYPDCNSFQQKKDGYKLKLLILMQLRNDTFFLVSKLLHSNGLESKAMRGFGI